MFGIYVITIHLVIPTFFVEEDDAFFSVFFKIQKCLLRIYW